MPSLTRLILQQSHYCQLQDSRASVQLIAVLVLLLTGGQSFGQQAPLPTTIEELEGEDRFIAAVRILSAKVGDSSVVLYRTKKKPSRSLALAPDPQKNVANAVLLLEAFLSDREIPKNQRQLERASRYLVQAKGALSPMHAYDFLTSLSYRHLTDLPYTFDKGLPWRLSLPELQRLLPGWQPEHVREVEHGGVYGGIGYEPTRRAEEQVEVFWTSRNGQDQSNLAVVYVATLRSQLDRALAEYPNKSTGYREWKVGIIIGLYAVFFVVAVFGGRFFLRMWRRGDHPLAWLRRHTDDSKSRDEFFQQERLRGLFDAATPQHLSDAVKNPEALQRLMGQVQSAPQLCHFCAKNLAEIALGVYLDAYRITQKYKGKRTVQTTTHYAKKIFPRCSTCSKVHEQVERELGWATLVQLTLFCAAFMLVLPLTLMGATALLWVFVGLFAAIVLMAIIVYSRRWYILLHAGTRSVLSARLRLHWELWTSRST